MKTILAATLLVALAGPDYQKMLDEAKFSLAEAVDKGLKEAKEGAVVKVEIEVEKGKTIFTMDIAQGEKILEINLDVKDGSVVARATEEENQSKLVKAAKITVKQAIEASLKKAGGKAVSAELRVKEGRPEIEVRVFKEGKRTAVTVEGEKGEVTGQKDVKPPARKPGLLGIQGEAGDGGVRITGVMKAFPAEKAGLRKDDLITAANGKKVKDIDELRAVLNEIGEGGKVKIEYTRGGVAAEATVTLAAVPEEDEEGEEGEEK